MGFEVRLINFGWRLGDWERGNVFPTGLLFEYIFLFLTDLSQ